MTHDPTLEEMDQAKDELLGWLLHERESYSHKKYPRDDEMHHKLTIDMRQYGLVGGEWEVFLGNYLRRAQLFGIESPQGRQAFAKYIVTCMAALEMAIAVHGPMPKPGVPSGEIQEWT